MVLIYLKYLKRSLKKKKKKTHSPILGNAFELDFKIKKFHYFTLPSYFYH